MPKGNSKRLTEAGIERLKRPPKGRDYVEHFDAVEPGLALRVRPSGAKSWVLYYYLGGRHRKWTLGRHPGIGVAAARELAKAGKERARNGIDPREARDEAEKEVAEREQRDTFKAVAADWLKRDQGGRRSRGEVERVLNKDVLPAWGGCRIGDIGRRDALELIDRIADRGAPIMARRTHAHLHRLFRWAVGRGIVDSNPFADMPKPGSEVRRERVLSDGELHEVWRAADAHPFGPMVRLLILTAARRSEITNLRWSEIDGDMIRLEGDRTKTGEPRTIPLSAPALAIIDGLPRIAADGGGPSYVFTTTGDTPVSGWSRGKAIIDAKIVDARREALGDGTDAMPGWRLHDLRRTVATGLQRLGFRLEVIEAVLGHVSGSRAGIVGVYQRHAFDDEKRRALDAWGRHVGAIVNQHPAAKVVPLHA